MQINKVLILLLVLLSSLLGCNHRKVTSNYGDMPIEDIFTGFIGHRPDDVDVCMPKRKKLTTVEKQENKRISGILIACGLHNFSI